MKLPTQRIRGSLKVKAATVSLGLTLLFGAAPLAIWPADAQSIGISVNSELELGVIEFGASHGGSLSLGTDGNLSITGSGFVTNGIAQPGSITVTGPASGIVEVRCDTSGRMRLGNRSIDITETEIVVDIGQPPGAGSACQGVRGNDPPAAIIDLALTPGPNILIGGRIDVPTNGLVPGTYETAAAGGRTITIRVEFQ